MKTSLRVCLLALALGWLAAAPIRAESVKYESQPGSTVKVDGSSTIHDWTIESKLIAGFMEWEANSPIDPAQAILPDLKVIPKVEVSIPVRSLKSGKSLMDKIIYETMNQPTYAKIEYKLKEMTLKKDARKAGDPIKFDTKGELTVSGKTKPVAMVVSIENAEGGQLKVSGTAPVKMTDFGMQPPAPKIALGAIKTSDDVKIYFEWMTKMAGK